MKKLHVNILIVLTALLVVIFYYYNKEQKLVAEMENELGIHMACELVSVSGEQILKSRIVGMSKEKVKSYGISKSLGSYGRHLDKIIDDVYSRDYDVSGSNQLDTLLSDSKKSFYEACVYEESGGKKLVHFQ